MALLSSILLVLFRTKRMKSFIANHPQYEGSVNFLNYTAMLMNFTMCWMLFIFGVLNIGVTVA